MVGGTRSTPALAPSHCDRLHRFSARHCPPCSRLITTPPIPVTAQPPSPPSPCHRLLPFTADSPSPPVTRPHPPPSLPATLRRRKARKPIPRLPTALAWRPTQTSRRHGGRRQGGQWQGGRWTGPGPGGGKAALRLTQCSRHGYRNCGGRRPMAAAGKTTRTWRPTIMMTAKRRAGSPPAA